MPKYFVIADPHFSHDNIIRYCDRPYTSVEEMNDDLVKRWNNTVSKRDTVFVLGDFALDRAAVAHFTPLLNGRKILIKGNHDTYPNAFYLKCGFAEVSKYPILFEYCLMSHEPLLLSNTTPYFNFYGHVHNDPTYTDTPTAKCVSAERIDYTPYCFLKK